MFGIDLHGLSPPQSHLGTPLAPIVNGNQIRMVPLQDVVYFEVADKYVRAVRATYDYLIRTPPRELLPELDPPNLLANPPWHGDAR